MIFRSTVMKIYKFVCFATPSVARSWHRIATRLANEELERNWVKDVVDWQRYFSFRVRQPIMGQGLLTVEASRSHSDSQRLLPDNTQQSKETDFHAIGGIRTHNSSKRTSAELNCSTTRIGYWGIQSSIYRVSQKSIHPLLINIFGINLNEISISGWECNIMFSQQMAQALL